MIAVGFVVEQSVNLALHKKGQEGHPKSNLLK